MIYMYVFQIQTNFRTSGQQIGRGQKRQSGKGYKKGRRKTFGNTSI